MISGNPKPKVTALLQQAMPTGHGRSQQCVAANMLSSVTPANEFFATAFERAIESISTAIRDHQTNGPTVILVTCLLAINSIIMATPAAVMCRYHAPSGTQTRAIETVDLESPPRRCQRLSNAEALVLQPMLDALPQAQEERRSQRIARLQPHPGQYREASTRRGGRSRPRCHHRRPIPPIQRVNINRLSFLYRTISCTVPIFSPMYM
jgi:hypothetical protein